MTTTIQDTSDTDQGQPPEFRTAEMLTKLGDALIAAGTTPHMVRVAAQYPHGEVARVGDVARAIAAPLPIHRQIYGSWHCETTLEQEHLVIHLFCGVDEPPTVRRERLAAELAALDEQIAQAGA